MRKFIEENLRNMVQIDSESEGDMDEIIEYTSQLLDEINVSCEVIRGEDFKPVIIASHGEKGVCFSGHLDTVPVGDGWEHEQGEIVDDKMYGRGTLDMKGPCVSAIAAAQKLVEKDIPFSIIFTTDEEVTMNGAQNVADKPEVTEAPAVVVCEPTEMQVVNQEKGVYQFEITTEGKNAHASMPEKGDNAIVNMLPILKNLSRKNNSPAGDDKLSCCVDVVEGGEQEARAVVGAMENLLATAPDADVQYADVVDAHTLQPVDHLASGQNVLAAVAVFFGDTRLIDNAFVEVPRA